MRQVSLREFRTRGAKALEAVPDGETVLLAGQKGPAYFLIPVLGDVINVLSPADYLTHLGKD